MLFQPFDERKPVRIYYTSMPHWRQDNCTYFVTYRLADSIPAGVLREWEFEKLKWIQGRVKVGSIGNRTSGGDSIDNRTNGDDSIDNRTYRWDELFPLLSDSNKYAFLKCFNRKLNSYLDSGAGSCALRNPTCARMVLEGWEFFDGQRYELGDLVVMPNHVHVLITPMVGFELEDILQSRKRQSAREVNQKLSTSGVLWQKHSYDHIVRDVKELLAFQEYVANNPKKANLKTDQFLLRPHDWELPTD